MLSQTIQAYRKAKGLPQEELAARLHVVRQTISKWEKGLSVPDADMLIRLAEALDTTVSALLGEEPLPATEPLSPAELARRLEQLNEQFAARAERSRKRWRWFFCLLGVLAVWALARQLLGLWASFQFEQAVAASESMIGGADGPTSVYVSWFSGGWAAVLLPAAAGLAAVAGLWYTRRR